MKKDVECRRIIDKDWVTNDKVKRNVGQQRVYLYTLHIMHHIVTYAKLFHKKY